MKAKINSTDLQKFCFGVAAKQSIRKLIIHHSYNDTQILATMNDETFAL